MSELVVDDVSKQFATRGDPLVVLRGVSFQLESGRNLAIVGPSGSGKSTLLHAIGTLDPPTSGTIRLDGRDPYTLTEAELASFRNHNIGFIFQDHHLLPQLSVLENVLIPVLAEGGVDTDAEAHARSLIERVGLENRLEHRPGELSGGERGRVAIARALVRRPALLLADEPTGNLDRHTAGSVVDLMLTLQQQESMMLVAVTHSRELAERLERQCELVDGRLVE